MRCRFLCTHCKEIPEATEIVREHIYQHLFVKQVHLLLRCHTHFKEEGLPEFIEHLEILVVAEECSLLRRVVEDMDFLMSMNASSLTHKLLQQRCNTNMWAVREGMEALSVARKSSPIKLLEGFIRETVTSAWLITLGKSKHSSRPDNPHKFFYDASPVLTGEIRSDHMSIDNIKGVRGKL